LIFTGEGDCSARGGTFRRKISFRAGGGGKIEQLNWDLELSYREKEPSEGRAKRSIAGARKGSLQRPGAEDLYRESYALFKRELRNS